MKEKLQNFMIGRYGGDAFSKFLSIVTITLCVISLIFSLSLLSALALLSLVYCYFRMFSRDYAKRSAENAKYLEAKEKVIRIFKREKNMIGQRGVYHIYKCPDCKQKIRIPRGKGKISISCPACHKEFIKRS